MAFKVVGVRVSTFRLFPGISITARDRFEMSCFRPRPFRESDPGRPAVVSKI